MVSRSSLEAQPGKSRAHAGRNDPVQVDPRSVLAVVPARGGSKTIPRKNLSCLGGHPLLAWAVAAGRQAELVGRTLVSTDDEEIREVAFRYGAEAPFLRPAELAEDRTPDLPVFRHALEWLEREEAYRPQVVVQLRPTSPLRPPGLVDRAVASLQANPKASAARTVTPSEQNPFKMWRVEDGRLVPLVAPTLAGRSEPDIRPVRQESDAADSRRSLDVHESFNSPRQALPDTVWQTGQVDVTRRTTVLESASMSGPWLLPVQVEPQLAVDIDRSEDLARARWILSRYDGPLVRPGELWNLASVRALVLDFDGVLTDNRVYVLQDGREAVACDRSDGMGLSALREAGVSVAVLSTETNEVVKARCRKLGISCRTGLDDKLGALRELADEFDVELRNTVFVGNDRNDLACIRAAGIGVAVADARPEVLGESDWVLSAAGGQGAVRELCDQILKARR